MATRKSECLTAKTHAGMDDVEGAHREHGLRDGGDNRGIGRRTSVGATMGLTPTKPRGRNLVIAKATNAAKAAAARFDKWNAEDQQRVCGETSNKARKATRRKQATVDRGHAEARTYQAKSRESRLLYQNT